MTQIGILGSGLSPGTKHVIAELTNQERLRKARVHPLGVLLALSTYEEGQGFRGNLEWEPVSQIVDALNDAFYATFDYVEPTGQNWLLALDVSGSMGGYQIANSQLSCRDATAALAMVTARTESNWHIVGFQERLVPLSISPKQRLDGVISTISDLDFGSTDCAQPMLYACRKKIPVDTFVVYTDNETWAGSVHPFQALQRYRKEMGRPEAKLIVVGMISSDVSIADPSDAGMLDVAGFSTDTPTVISSFSKGEI